MKKEELKSLLAFHSRKEVSKILGVSSSTVQRLVRRFGLTQKKFNPKLTRDQVEEIRLFYFEKDIKQIDLASMFKVSQATIGRIVNKSIYKDSHNRYIISKAAIEISCNN